MSMETKGKKSQNNYVIVINEHCSCRGESAPDNSCSELGSLLTTTAPQPVVLVVEDERDTQIMIACILEEAGYVVHSFASAEEFLDRDKRPAVGCLLLDLALPGLGGLELQERVRVEERTLSIVFLTGVGNIPASVKAIKSGAVDFLTKPVNGVELLRAVGGAIEQSRNAYLQEREEAYLRERFAALTARQAEVLQLLLTGMLNKQVAAELGIKEKTVKVHRGQVIKRLQVHSVAELVRLSEKAGFFPPRKP
jgi:FixJ family two-component response regulator